MKKTMFITSIVMVVVLAIALTTSSLAWFSAGGATRVTVSDFNVVAAVGADASGLEIANASYNSGTNTYTANGWKSASAISLVPLDEHDNPTDVTGASPMVPTKATAFTVTETIVDTAEFYDALNTMYTNTALLVDSVSQFGSDLAAAQAWSACFALRNQGENSATIAAGSSDATSKFRLTVSQVANHENTSTHQMETTGNEATLWVAIFEIGVTNNAKGGVTGVKDTGRKLVALASSNGNSENISYALDGQLAAGEETADIPHFTYAQFSQESVTLEAGEYDGDAVWQAGNVHFYEIYAWYDGVSLHNGNDYTKVQISLAIGSAS